MYHSMFNHSPTERHLGCFQLGVITNKAAMSIPVQVFMSKGYSEESEKTLSD